MPETEPKALCYFDGATVAAVAHDLAEYGHTALIIVLKQVTEYYLQVHDENGIGGDPYNQSHPCPGSPGCP